MCIRDRDTKSRQCRSFAGLLVGEDHRRDLAEEFSCCGVGPQSMERISWSIGPVFGRRQQVGGAWCDGIDGRDDWASQSSRDPLESGTQADRGRLQDSTYLPRLTGASLASGVMLKSFPALESTTSRVVPCQSRPTGLSSGLPLTHLDVLPSAATFQMQSA